MLPNARIFALEAFMSSRTTLIAASLLAVGFYSVDVSAQTIRNYGSQAEKQYGGSSTGNGTAYTPGAPVPQKQQGDQTAATTTATEGGKKGGDDSNESSPNYVTVFSAGTTSQKPVQELNLTETEMYRGVIPGKRDSVAHLSLEDTGGSNRITWIGFQSKDESSRVFFQTVRPADYEIRSGETSNVLVVRFSDTKIPVRNFKRFIDTTAFKWNVRRIDAAQSGRDVVEVTIELETDEEPIISRNGGYLYLDFKKKAEKTENNS